MKYMIKGYNGPSEDFCDVIELAADIVWDEVADGDRRYNRCYASVKAALLNSNCATDYLNVFDECSFEVRHDLADVDGQIVLLAESYGCDNCVNSQFGNMYQDGCDGDAPHGGFLITFDPVWAE